MVVKVWDGLGVYEILRRKLGLVGARREKGIPWRDLKTQERGHTLEQLSSATAYTLAFTRNSQLMLT